MKKEITNFKKSKEGLIERFGRRKGEGEMM